MYVMVIYFYLLFFQIAHSLFIYTQIGKGKCELQFNHGLDMDRLQESTAKQCLNEAISVNNARL